MKSNKTEEQNNQPKTTQKEAKPLQNHSLTGMLAQVEVVTPESL